MKKTVLLADDHGVVRDGLFAILSNEPTLEIIGQASNGNEVLSFFEAHRCPDILIIDIQMPELDGLSTIKKIKETCANTRAIVLSMHEDDAFVQEALRSGALGYLLKESVGQEVVQAVEAVLSGRRYLSQKILGKVIDGYLAADVEDPADQEDPLAELSGREREVFHLVVTGKSSSEIASTLFLSPKTVDTYRSRVMQKLEIENIPELVKFAIKQGLIQ